MLEQYKALFEDNCPYTLNEKVSLEKIKQFEAMANIVLPQGYKDFLLYIGNGAKQHRQFPLSISHATDCLETCLRSDVGLEYMSLPFSLENCNKCFDERLEAIDDDVTDDEYETFVLKALQGTLTLHNDGCGYFVVLVVTGELAGKLLFIDTCHGRGAHLISDSFEEYYVKWLDNKITEQLSYMEQNNKFDCTITHVKLGGNVRDLEVITPNHFKLQFEYYCPQDFVREGGYSDLTKTNDKLLISLYMEHKSYSPLECEIINNENAMESINPITLIGDRSEHIVIGQVNRLFKYKTNENSFPLYIEALQQEILIKGAAILNI
ncbi:hypothetical protein D3C78_1154520 [compost metagenome]